MLLIGNLLISQSAIFFYAQHRRGFRDDQLAIQLHPLAENEHQMELFPN